MNRKPINPTLMPAYVAHFVIEDMGQDNDGQPLAGAVLRGLVPGKPLANTLVMLPLEQAEQLYEGLGRAIANRKQCKFKGEKPKQ